MKSSNALHKTFWQNPFVDIFKHFPLSEKDNVDKQGEISEHHDKQIAKKVLKISGAISGANYVTIPSKKVGLNKTLGLNGRYLYLACMVPSGSIFSVHIEYKTLNKHTKLSLSNLFKTTKVISDTNVQVPFNEPLTKWSIVCIDAKKFLKEILELAKEGKNRTVAFPEAKDLDIELISLQLCAKMFVRGVYTSDNLYTPKTLPKDMSFRLSKSETFEQVYNWYTMDSFLNPNIFHHVANSEQLNKENKENNPTEENYKTVSISNKTSGSTLKKGISHKTQPPKDKRSSPSKPKAKPFEMPEISEQELEPEKNQPQRIKEDDEEEKLFIDRKSTKSKDDVKEEKEVITKNIKFKSEHFQLEPNPIMALTHFQGFQSQGKNLLMVDDNSVLYSCGNTICLMDIKSRVQRFFIGQKDAVSCLAVYGKQNIVVSADDSDKNGRIYLWTLYPQTLQTSFLSGISNIRCVDIATRMENQRKMLLLLVVGKDQLKRDVIALFDITDFVYKEPYLFCKKISDFDIRAARFVEKRDASHFITCGKESVRFWKLKHKLLNGTSLVLNEHGRDTIFNDFCVFNYEDYVNTGTNQEGETVKGNYKVVFCSDKGNVYLVDYKEEIMSGIFKLHEGGVTCLNVNPTNHYFITSGEDKMVRLWNMDITQMLLEIKVDSQVNHLLLNARDQIFCGSLNGSIGELKLNERKMDFIVRSHCDSIIMMDYHPLTKNLITISRDLTIKVWDLRSGHITQSYEFRCLDEQVCFVRCFHKSELFVCGFESGSLRVFDLASSSVVSELDSHTKQIVDIAISPNDQFIATTDLLGVIHIYDGNLQFTRAIENDLKYQSQKLCFDYYNDYLLVCYNPNTIRILKTGTWNISYTISIQEDIVKASFSPVKNDLFILTSKSQLKKCRLQENSITMEREYWTLHNGLITDFQISRNAGYIFTVGEDNLLKVWDYFMRGKLTPAFQAFTTGSKIKDVLLTNDSFNFIFSYGIDNNGIFCWQFYSDFVENVVEPDLPIEEELLEKEEKPQFYQDSMNERDFLGENENVTTVKKSTRPLTGMVQSIYHEVEDLVGVPTSTINLKQPKQPQQNKTYEDTHEEQEENDDDLNRRALAWNTIEELLGEKKGMAEELAEEMIRQKRVTFNEVEQYAFTEENLMKSKKEFLEFEDSPHKTPDTYKLPGQHLKIETVIGASMVPGNSSVVWNNQDNYIAYALNSSLVISYLEEPKVQKHLTEHHSDDISLLTLSLQGKYLVSASGIAKNEASCNISIWDASKILYLKTLTHAKLQTISSIDISPCENYLLVLGESGYEEHALLYIWEIQSGLLVSHTLYPVPRGRHAKWNTKIRGSLEFTLLTEETITFWRLNHVRSLEYQEAIYDKLIMKGHKFININFLESKLFKDTSFMLVGTSLGALMIFDTRSNTLLFTYNKLLKGPINEIFSYKSRLVLSTEDAGVYSWKLDPVSDPSDLAKMLEENPDILLVDSKPCCGYFLAEKKGNEGLIATKGGVFWYINWEERATVRLLTTHVSSCTVTALKAHSMDSGNVLVSSGTDGTVRVWDIDSLEQKSEFFVPRREALSVDIYREASKCVCGFSDGYVRFFDYEKDINYGGSLLRIDNGDPSKALEDRGFPVTAVCFLKNGRNILAGNMNGEVYMIYIKSWENIRIEVRSLISNVGFGINHIALSELEPWDTWALSTKNRKVMVWNRKDLSFGKKDLDYYDKLFEKINNLEYYLIDNYRVQKKDEKDLNFDNFEAEHGVNNKYEYSGDTVAKFVSNKPDLYVVITNQLNEVFFRDYKEHLIIKTLKIHGVPRSFFLREKDNEIIIGTQDGSIRFLDYELGLEKDVVNVGANGIMNLEICVPKKLEFSMSTLRLEPVRGKSRTLVCSSRNGILIGKLDS